MLRRNKTLCWYCKHNGMAPIKKNKSILQATSQFSLNDEPVLIKQLNV